MKYVPNRSFFDILTEDDSLERQIFVLLFNYSALLKSLYILKKQKNTLYSKKKKKKVLPISKT